MEPGLETEVTWSLADGNNLFRTEAITASKAVTIRRLWMAVPTKADHIATRPEDGTRPDQLTSAHVTFDVRVLSSDWPMQISAFAIGDDSLGRGDRGPIPLNLILETKHEVTLQPNSTKKWGGELTRVAEPHP
jgi:hypothetical protein